MPRGLRSKLRNLNTSYILGAPCQRRSTSVRVKYCPFWPLPENDLYTILRPVRARAKGEAKLLPPIFTPEGESKLTNHHLFHSAGHLWSWSATSRRWKNTKAQGAIYAEPAERPEREWLKKRTENYFVAQFHIFQGERHGPNFSFKHVPFRALIESSSNRSTWYFIIQYYLINIVCK